MAASNLLRPDHRPEQIAGQKQSHDEPENVFPTHGDLGQIQFYVNYYDRERRTEGDNPTLGVILCPDKNDAVVKYTLGEQQERNIFASRYQLHLPTEQELESELRREIRYLSVSETVRVPAKKQAKRGA